MTRHALPPRRRPIPPAVRLPDPPHAAGRLRNHAGMVLPTVIFALVIMLVVAAVMLQIGTDVRSSSRSSREGSLALLVAEGGLRRTLGAWPAAATALAPGDSLDLGWQQLPNRATHRTVIRRVDGGTLQSYNLVTQGRSVSGLAGQSTVTAMVVGVPIFKWGLFSQGNIAFSGTNAMLDGYDSEVAPYTAATADSTGSMATNSNITLNTSTVVLGDLAAVGTIVAGTGVTGSRTPGYTPAFPVQPIVACPTTGYTPASALGTLPSGMTYNQTTGVLTIGGSNVLTLTGTPSQYYFSTLTIAGSARIVMNTTTHVDIFVSDLLTVAGGGISNPSGRAPLLTISACGNGPTAPASTWTFSGGSSSAFAVYAPNHPVVLSGGGDLYGSIVGSSITASGGIRMHYDMALSRLPSKNFVLMKGSWAQLP